MVNNMAHTVMAAASSISLSASAYTTLLQIFQWGPLASIPQWLSDYHPCGKFSRRTGANVPGRLAWFLMESVGPWHMLWILSSLAPNHAITELRLAAGLYLVHYLNRAVVGPLFVAPSMSPVGMELLCIVSFHNWYNTAILAPWIAGARTYDIEGYPGLKTTAIAASERTIDRAIPYIGIALFGVGMLNNIRAERRLWRMRRQQAQDQSKGGAVSYAKVYVLPPNDGLFRSTLCPHYFWEWVEWFGYVLVGTAVRSTTPVTAPRPSIKLAPWLEPVAALAWRAGIPLPLAPLAYVLIFVSVMLPQARRSLRWYRQKFGDEGVAGRSAVVPGVSFL
ncbi:3-oxo-5-alpha-steroid 4-dehydrogenase family protein [Teratosphaeria destructans]|uniref:3-oxo-5-alpha-steroid 4-dehydrogenase family protein n=1 Tax=Teratosphaeria destructans TaxID=418781 RepID=A0A9W7SZS2_9PEZI|nr:3-oxo-5-alpha-steroid 4-dehydrogenase family protein [Teratosphaeria destructans]